MNCNVADDLANGQEWPRRVVVIGYGSPIRGDDAVGPIVADLLRSLLDDPRIEVFSRHVLTAELADPLRDATLAVFIDAAAHGQAGQVATRPLRPNTGTAGGMAHTLDAEALLGWVAGLYGKAPEAVLVSTAGVSFDYASYQLTPTVAALVDHMAERVRDVIRHHLDTAAHS